MYDFAHPISDALEGITHSLCSLEYEDHRPLYDWVVEHAQNMLPGHPRQIEFSRLNLTQTSHVQALPAHAGGRGLCVRLGRSPDAHAVRHAPPGLHSRRHS